MARYASRFHLPSSAKSILRPPAVGLRHTHIRRGQARPTRGLIYATSDLAKPTQRERLSLSPPQQRSLAPIVNGLLTVDVKWLFLPPDFLFVIRVVSFSIQQWQEFGMGLRAMPSNPIESHSI